MAESGGREALPEALPEALAARLAAVETHAVDADFDHTSWIWMVLLGVLLPVALLALGWWL